jgi:hypothetical protein
MPVVTASPKTSPPKPAPKCRSCGTPLVRFNGAVVCVKCPIPYKLASVA